MFPSFISILDIQSWWEVPSIAHFCSLFRAAFNLLDFDIEELEEALLTDGTEDSGSSLLQELIVRLLCGCLGSNDVSTFNYQMFLRRLFRQKCQEHGRYNPFNTDIDFQFLPLRTKVEILHALCDFRLDAEDVLDLLKNLEAESLRVEPLGYDDNDSAYWYFYGTRLYREDYEKTSKKSSGKQKTSSVWQVICFTEQDWNHLTSKFKGATSKTEKALYRSLSENFLPEIPRLFQEKERQQRKRLLELQPRRSSRVQDREKHRSEDLAKPILQNLPSIVVEENETKTPVTLSARELRAIQRDICKSGSESGSRAESPAMPTQKADVSGLTSVGRQTNNSLASATGQILIQSSTQRKKLKTSQVFRQTEEDLQTGMYKILEYVKNHDDAWPFIEPVEEDYAPNYYSIVRKPMDLQRMEDKLDAGEYLTFSKFKADFQLIVDNCRLYNGTDNEYTEMVDNLQQAFQRATDRFLDQITSSDEEIAVEFQQKSSTKENVKENKKNKSNQLKKEKDNQNTNSTAGVKRKSSPIPQPIEKPTKAVRNNRQRQNQKSESPRSKKSKSPDPPPVEIKQKKAKQLKKEKVKVREKSPVVVAKKSKKSNKNTTRTSRRSESRTRSPTRSRSQSKARSWTSSPSPPPPRIQKKKKLKQEKEENKKDKKLIQHDNIVKKTEEKELVKENVDVKPTMYFNSNKIENKEKKKDTSIPQLSETIEKLKQNSINSKKESLDLNYKPKVRDKDKIHDNKTRNVKPKVKEKLKENKKTPLTTESIDSENEMKDSGSGSGVIETKKKHFNKKVVKKAGIIKNPAAIKALDLATEQTLKDINKWLDDTPKFSELSNSPSQSPLPLTNLDDFDAAASKLENEYKLNQQKEKLLKLEAAAVTVVAPPTPIVPIPPAFVPPVKPKEPTKDPSSFKRRNTHKDPNKLQKRREIQRTIDRLQPGKSKGNLIANIQSNKDKVEDTAFPLIGLAKLKDSKNAAQAVPSETTPKLSLGTVLDSFGQQHNFVDEKEEIKDEKPQLETEILKEENQENSEKIKDETVKEDKEAISTNKEEVEPVKVPMKTHKQENVTPNLSAWFKAFGAPKSAAVTAKKQKDSIEIDNSKEAENVVSPVSADERLKSSSDIVDDAKKMLSSPMPSPAPEIPGPNQPAPRMRKASTGSTVSERSSFSQDMTDPLDSPRLSVDERLGMYPTPYRSPMSASPHHNEEKNGATYPPLNGNIRVGFYQDTVKSSPEKSCSPRDQPQSPHNPQQYSQHVYIPPPPTSTTYHHYSNPPSCSGPSPSHSPVYNQQVPAPPPYNSSHMINPFFDKPPPTYHDSIAPLVSKSPPPRTPPQQSEIEPKSPPPQRPSPTPPPPNVIKPHLNTVIPVKKRLYSESSDADGRIITSSPHTLNMTTSSNVRNLHHPHDVMSNMFVERIGEASQLIIPNKSSFLPTSVPPLESNVKNYSMPMNTLPGSLDNTRGLNLQIPQSEPLNIPNPIKTIDLTGPDSPSSLYNSNRQQAATTMNMPLDSRIEHNMQHQVHNRVGVGANPMDIVQLSQQYTAKNLLPTKDVLTSMQSQTNVTNSTQLPYNMNLHHNLRIPNVPHQNTNQDLQRNDFRTSQESRLPSMPQSVPMNLDANPFSSPNLETLRGNLANLSHIVVDRYQNDERLLTTPTYYSDPKNLGAQPSIYSKQIPTSIHHTTNSSHPSLIPQSNMLINTTASSMNFIPTTIQQQIVKPAMSNQEKKGKKRKSKTSSSQQSAVVSSSVSSDQGFQSYSGLKQSVNTVNTSEPSAISLKTTSVVPGSAFNFGPAPPTLGLSSSLYNDKDTFSGFLDDYRNPTTNYYMAAQAAAVQAQAVHHNRSTPDGNDKSQRVGVPQAVTTLANSSTTAPYPYLGHHSQSRPTTYAPFIHNPHSNPLMDTSSPLYQQYLQRHQEELLRHSAGVLHQGLLGPSAAYPPGYPPLSIRQPFDTINRPSWL